MQHSQRAGPSSNRGNRSKRGRGRAGKYIRPSTVLPKARTESADVSVPNVCVNTEASKRLPSDPELEEQNDSSHIQDSSSSPPTSDEVLKLKQQLHSTAESLNTMKKKVASLEDNLGCSKMTINILQEKIAKLQKELKLQTQENAGLVKINEELELKLSNTGKKMPKFVVKLSKSLDRKYVTLALALERKLASWALAESMEIYNTLEDTKHRNWSGRMEKVQNCGIERVDRNDTDNIFNFVPTVFPAILSSTNLLFIPSFNSIESVIADQLDNIFKEDTWSPFCSDPAIRLETIQVLSTNTVLIGKAKQLISDAFSNRKRVVKDEFFSLLRYFSLKSSHDKRRDTPLYRKDEEIIIAKQKLVRSIPATNVRDYSWWRTASIKDLSSDYNTSTVFTGKNIEKDNPTPLELEDDREVPAEESKFMVSSLGIHKNELSVHLWKLYLGFDPLLNQENQTEMTILSITRLDSWLATVVDLLVTNEKRGGARQRDYNNLFHKHFILATYQLISDIYDFVYFWVPEELSLNEHVGDNYREHILNMEREATIVLYSSVNSTYYLALQCTWFSEFISSNLGVVHDCFIARITHDWKHIKKLTRTDIQEFESPSFRFDSINHSAGNSDSNNTSHNKSYTTDHEMYEEDTDAQLAPTVVPSMQL